MKPTAIIFVICGLLLTGYGCFQYIATNKQQNESLSMAYRLLEKSNYSSEQQRIAEPIPAVIESQLELGEVLGILSIPKIEAELAIVEGTNANDLEKGVGHYRGTALPLQNNQIVLSGHRDTVFRRMGELRPGDALIIHMPYGIFSYEMVSSRIVNANDLTVIKPTAPKEILTVITCYPFSFIGNAPDRYVITAVPIKID